MCDSECNKEILDFIRGEVAQRVGMSIDGIQADTGLIAAGLQSIDAVLICGEVEDRFKVELDPSVIFEHKTVGSFAAAVTLLLSAR